MGLLPFLIHVGFVLAGSPVFTLLAYQYHVRKGAPPADSAAAVRRRVLKTSSQLELFLTYSFLLLGDKYPLFDRLRGSAGLWAAVALFSVPVLLGYAFGALARSHVDRRIRRLDISALSSARFHILLLFLRMGVFVLATPLFFFKIYSIDLMPWHPRNIFGIACVSLLFFLYVLRGPNVVFSLLGMLRRFPDTELEGEIRQVASDRQIAVRGIRVLGTRRSRFAGAFAHFGSSQIFVTEHLPEVVDRDELKAVLFHEVGHLGQLKASFIRILGSYLVFLVFVFLKYLIDATALRRLGLETLVPGFFLFAVVLLVIRHYFGRIIREGEAQADLFSAEIVGGQRPYQQAIAKVLLANGLSMQFTPSAQQVAPTGAQIEEELW